MAHENARRRSVIVSGLAAFATAATASPALADFAETTSKDKHVILATLKALLDAITNRDKEAMRATFMPDGAAVHSRNGAITIQRLGDLPDSMPGGTSVMQEHVHDIHLRIDHDIAAIWAPYEFYYDDVLDHVGTNIFSFLKQPDDRWLICGLTDNGRSVR